MKAKKASPVCLQRHSYICVTGTILTLSMAFRRALIEWMDADKLVPRETGSQIAFTSPHLSISHSTRHNSPRRNSIRDTVCVTPITPFHLHRHTIHQQSPLSTLSFPVLSLMHTHVPGTIATYPNPYQVHLCLRRNHPTPDG